MKTKTLVFIRDQIPSEGTNGDIENMTTKVNETIKDLEDKDCFIKDIKLINSTAKNIMDNDVLIYTYLILYEEKKP